MTRSPYPRHDARCDLSSVGIPDKFPLSMEGEKALRDAEREFWRKEAEAQDYAMGEHWTARESREKLALSDAKRRHWADPSPQTQAYLEAVSQAVKYGGEPPLWEDFEMEDEE